MNGERPVDLGPELERGDQVERRAQAREDSLASWPRLREALRAGSGTPCRDYLGKVAEDLAILILGVSAHGLAPHGSLGGEGEGYLGCCLAVGGF